MYKENYLNIVVMRLKITNCKKVEQVIGLFNGDYSTNVHLHLQAEGGGGPKYEA
jgi:hypothetical protein